MFSKVSGVPGGRYLGGRYWGRYVSRENVYMGRWGGVGIPRQVGIWEVYLGW